MTKYVSIDIETTGLDPEMCQVLEIGAVIEDWTRPIELLDRWHCYVVHRQIVGEPYALSMHGEMLRLIANRDVHSHLRFLEPRQVGLAFRAWLDGYEITPKSVLAAGKNFASFDRAFLYKLDGFKEAVQFHHRCIDPAMLYWNPDTDDKPPSTEECCRRAGLPTDVAHTAIADAMQVIKLVRHAAERKRCWTSENLVEGLIDRLPK